LDGGPTRRKAATCRQDSTDTEYTRTAIHASNGIGAHDRSVRAGENSSCLRARGTLIGALGERRYRNLEHYLTLRKTYPIFGRVIHVRFMVSVFKTSLSWVAHALWSSVAVNGLSTHPQNYPSIRLSLQSEIRHQCREFCTVQT
jgi:hypothetical protein